MQPEQVVWNTEGDYPGWALGQDPFTGHRNERWEWRVMTLEEAPVGVLDGVMDGQLDFNVANRIRGGGSVSWAGTSEPEWPKIMLQPWFTVETAAGELSWPLGVFIPEASPAKHADEDVTVDLELYDKLLILDQDAVDKTYTVAKGANVVAAIRTVINSAGQRRHAVEDNTATLASAMVWEPGTPKLTIVNDLLDAINYFSLWCDGYGVYQGRPYQAPGERPTARTFADDDESIYAPTFTHDRDRFGVPNKVVQVGASDGDTPPPVATATNTDPASPYSYPARGRWITVTDTNVEAANQAVLNGIARRRLAELTQTASVVEFQHAHVPMALNDVVEFRRDARGIAVRAAIQSYSISTQTGELVSTKIREVAE